MEEVIDILLYRTWWRYEDYSHSAFAEAYHWFNIIEGFVWIAIGVLIFARFGRHRHSTLEVFYALSFIAFGLTDFAEAMALQSWLIWVKAIILGIVLYSRRIVLQRYYPNKRVF